MSDKAYMSYNNRVTALSILSMIKLSQAILGFLCLILFPSFCAAEIKSEQAMTPQMAFMEAIQKGQVDVVRKFVTEGKMDPNQILEGGVTPLHVAVMKNQEPIVAVLLEAKAKINEKDATTMASPLHMAALYGRTSIAKLLLQKGADVNARMKFGITPLMVSAQFNHPEIAELLLANRANTNLADDEGFTALHCAAQTGDEITAKLLIKQGARLDARDRLHATPATIAQQNNNQDMLRLLEGNSKAESSLQSGENSAANSSNLNLNNSINPKNSNAANTGSSAASQAPNPALTDIINAVGTVAGAASSTKP